MFVVVTTIPLCIIIYPQRATKQPVGIAIRPGYMLKPTSKKMENFLSNFFEYVYMFFGILAVSLVVCGGAYGIVNLFL